MIKRYTVYFFISIFLFSCKGEMRPPSVFSTSGTIVQSARNLIPIEYKKEIELPLNGLQVQKTVENFTFSAQYRPYEYIIGTELKKEVITKDELEKGIREINQLQYFTFKINADDAGMELLKVNLKSPGEYNYRVEYCSFQMQNDFQLVDGTDTLNCALYHFERIYGIAPYGTFMLGFPLSKKEEASRKNKQSYLMQDKTLIYDDKVFEMGRIYLKIEAKNLNRLPKLVTG